jgi:acyl-CoA reductase-like NAD-dependent aldehyde dehydrogenase
MLLKVRRLIVSNGILNTLLIYCSVLTVSYARQVCSAGSRLLIQETIFDTFIAKLKQRMKTLRLGDSLDKVIDMGPLVDESQRRSVDELVQSARAEGAEVYIT